MIKFKFLEVIDKKLLEKVFSFRYEILMDIYPEYIQKSSLNDAREYDRYDVYSTHFAALNEAGEVCATVRLIYNSPIGYPAENSMKFDKNIFQRDRLGEMSRIFVDSRYRKMKTTKIIIEGLKKLTYMKMMQEGLEYTYGSLEENFLRLLKIYKMPYHTIGEKQKHGNFGYRYPCALFTKELRRDNPEFEKLEEDLYEIQL